MKLDLEFYEDVIEDTFDGVYFVDLDRRITYWNKGAERLTGFTPEEVIGRRCCDGVLAHTDKRVVSLCEVDCPLSGTMNVGVSHESEVFLRHKDGHRLVVTVRTKPLKDSDGKVVGAAEIFRDKTHQEATEQKIAELEELALIDPLTKMANRRHAERTLKARLEEMSRYDWNLGVLFIDIDNFKEINDAHGHHAGDKVMVLSSRTILNSLRPFDFLGRWGGDEFVAIITNVSQEQLFEIADRMRLLVSKTNFEFDSNLIDVTVSVGAALAQKNDTIQDVLNRADRLMYESKRSGRNRVTALP